VTPQPERTKVGTALEDGPIVRPGHNCWRVDRADQLRCIQDAAEYFGLVRRAMLSARRTLFLLGWDTSPHTDLLPGENPTDGPTRLDQLIAFIAHRRPDLRCYLLTWDYGLVHLFERDPFTRWRLGWRMPKNVVFAFDDHHPVGACHHQKVVVVDDRLAFSGGIDLTGHRWDTPAHRVDDPSRISLDGDAYPPYHEVQAMVSGPAAAALGELARERWRALGVEALPPVDPTPEDLWPKDAVPDLTDAPVAIARTVPAWETQPAIREAEALYLDSIARARRTIYIESQYFTADHIADALAIRLTEVDGPEVILVTPKCCEGWLEQATMGVLRDEVMRRLIAADRYGRLRVVYPAASQSRDVATFVHSKVMFIDDQLARIGSSNLSKRSMGVDSECDLAIDAGGDRRLSEGILRIRDRLLAEHLGAPADVVTRAVDAGESIRAIVDAHRAADRTLVPLPTPDAVDESSEALIAAADPIEPIATDVAVRAVLAAPGTLVGATPARTISRLGAAAVACCVVGLGVFALWGPSVPWPRTRPTRATGGAMLFVAAVAGLRSWLFARRATRVVSNHHRRSEFG
jgi:phospholipase D1/2